jgi:transcriptional antiterminator RfaH
MDWYAVNTKPRQENIAQWNLERLGVDSFCPQLRQDKVIRRKRQVVISPLFPGYLFVRFNVDTHCRAVNYAQGVRGVVAFGSVPAKVDDEMIESIKTRLEDGCVIIQPPSFTPGQTVRIQEGPFEGLEAVFEREMTAQQRVVVMLKALSYQARVVVDREQVVNL